MCAYSLLPTAQPRSVLTCSPVSGLGGAPVRASSVANPLLWGGERRMGAGKETVTSPSSAPDLLCTFIRSGGDFHFIHPKTEAQGRSNDQWAQGHIARGWWSQKPNSVVYTTSGCLPDQPPGQFKSLYLPGQDKMRVDCPVKATFMVQTDEARK